MIILATCVLEPRAHRRSALAEWARLAHAEDQEGLRVYWGLVTVVAWVAYALTFFPAVGAAYLTDSSVIETAAFIPSTIFEGHGVVGMIQIGRVGLPFWRSRLLGPWPGRWAVLLGVALLAAAVWS